MVPLSQQQQQKQQQYTLGFLKPDVMNRKTELMQLVKSNTLWTLTFEKELRLSLKDAKRLYPQGDIASWLSSHSIHVFILEGPNVVKNWYKYAGPKDPAKAKQFSSQSLRAIYGLDDIQNVCHASSSDTEVQRDLTWIQKLIPDCHLSIPLDTGSASLSKQRRNSSASTKPSSTNVAVTKFSKTSVTKNLAATATTKHLSTSSDSSSSASSLPSLSGTKMNPLTRQPMNRSRANASPATPSSATKPAAQANLTPPSQQSITIKHPLSKTARKEIKASRPKAKLEPLTGKLSSDSAKTMELNSIKRISNTQVTAKTTPGISVLPGRQSRLLSRMEKQQNDTVTAASSSDDDNDIHIQPQQQQNSIDTIPYSTTHDDGSNNGSNKIENDMVDSHVPYSINDILDCMDNDNDTGGQQQQPSKDPYATTASFSSNSLASTSTSSTVDSNHHDEEVIAATLPISAMVGSADNKIRIISPNSNPIYDNRHTTTPDVDNLRHEFEALGQNKVVAVPPSRTSSIRHSIQLASRIKDLKPKNPSGSRVKGMVAFFMDENLHKWEF